MVSQEKSSHFSGIYAYPLDKLAYTHSGSDDRPAVLILHGWGSSAQIMSGVALDLAQEFSVFNLDLPGHGQSPSPTESIDVPAHADLVHQFIEKNIRKPVTLLGHSNGGRIGLFMASSPKYRNLIQKLVLISPSGIKPRRGLSFYVKTWTAKTLKAPFVFLPEPLRGLGLAWVRGTYIWQLLGSSDYRSVTGVMRDVFTQTVRFFVDDVISDISCPTLLLWGTNDSAVSRYQIDRLVNGIENIQLVELDGAEHYGFLDQPQKTLASIRAFLGGLT